jgi:hypothetical protein
LILIKLAPHYLDENQMIILLCNLFIRHALEVG